MKNQVFLLPFIVYQCITFTRTQTLNTHIIMLKLRFALSYLLVIIVTITLFVSCDSNNNIERVYSDTPITLLPTKHGNDLIEEAAVKNIIHDHFSPDDHRHIKVHAIHDDNQTPAHLIVYQLHKEQHRVAVSSVKLNADLEVQAVTHNYKPTESDNAQHMGTHEAFVCPDETVQFIAFCPNQNDLELQITNEVADTAEAQKFCRRNQ